MSIKKKSTSDEQGQITSHAKLTRVFSSSLFSPSPTRTRTWTRTRHHLSRPPKEISIFSIPDEYAVPCCRLLLHRCCGIHDGWCRGSQCYRWGCCLGFCEGNTSISSPPPFRSFPTNFRPQLTPVTLCVLGALLASVRNVTYPTTTPSQSLSTAIACS